jgi:hypothetical protein
MVSPEELKEKEASSADIRKSLMDIGQRINRQSNGQKADVVFVVDGGAEMRGVIEIVEKGLVSMVSPLESSAIDYQLSLISFQFSNGTPEMKVNRLQRDFGTFQNDLRNLRIKMGDSGAGYGLDAIMQGIRELEFRADASKNLVVVTNHRLKTSWGADDAEARLVGEIINLCTGADIHINVLGVGEPAQTRLADETGGKWYPIDERQKRPSSSASLVIDKSILKIDGVFKHISQHIASTVTTAADIVFVFDSSLSMDNKVEEICNGVDRMTRILDGEGLDYRFGVIRFWAKAGGGESTVIVTKPPLNAEQVKNLFRISKSGDEHLLDAIIEGVPKLDTPAERRLVLIVVTDEATSNRLHEKGYTARGAIAVCQAAGAQVNVIGGVTPISSGSFSDEFQQRVAEATKGLHFIMPGSTIADERR